MTRTICGTVWASDRDRSARAARLQSIRARLRRLATDCIDVVDYHVAPSAEHDTRFDWRLIVAADSDVAARSIARGLVLRAEGTP